MRSRGGVFGRRVSGWTTPPSRRGSEQVMSNSEVQADFEQRFHDAIERRTTARQAIQALRDATTSLSRLKADAAQASADLAKLRADAKAAGVKLPKAKKDES